MGEKISVQFKDFKDVNKFVNILSDFEEDFDLYCGRYCVDAKSILGILTMDLRNPMFLTGTYSSDKRQNLIYALRKHELAA